MRLFDTVSQAGEPLLVGMPGGAVVELPGPSAIAPLVRAAPLRYVLDGSVTEFVAACAFTKTEWLIDCMELVRLPAQSLWFEWDDSERAAVLRHAGFRNASDCRRRAGALISGSTGGRSGSIQIVWIGDDGEAELSPVVIAFDLDDPAFSSRCVDRDYKFSVSLAGHEALEAVFRHSRFQLRREWTDYYNSLSLSPAEEYDVLRGNFEAAAAEFPFFIGFLLALAARNALTLSPVALDRLNRARGRSGKQDLLDYTEVSAQIGRYRANAAGDFESSRREARQHFVSGHLVRRGERIFWRRAHLRGNPRLGTVLGRNIKVRMAPEFVAWLR